MDTEQGRFRRISSDNVGWCRQAAYWEGRNVLKGRTWTGVGGDMRRPCQFERLRSFRRASCPPDRAGSPSYPQNCRRALILSVLKSLTVERSYLSFYHHFSKV